MKQLIFIALGTNMGDRQANLQAAIHAMRPAVTILDRSPVYETPPWGYEQQPEFLNQVVKGYTELPPLDLLTFLKDIERQMGRQKTIRYGPRLIDLDILLYDDLVMDNPKLVIPHPRLAERAFVLVPLADLAPDLRHPVLGQTIKALKEQVDISGIRPYKQV
ncbi:MAG: 2-amino-4-hydroxy-6-hydroxymethyldihydropteridine diphosphokinase [Anaerolineales bacterium]|jgi:2-amino-4-hydroxy-6-hydroxymethyldihydropteridine diphosphokinase